MENLPINVPGFPAGKLNSKLNIKKRTHVHVIKSIKTLILQYIIRGRHLVSANGIE